MFEFLWEFRQEGRLNDAEAKARRAVSDAGDARRDAFDLRARVDSLGLLTMAMWSILQERFGVTEAELAQRVRDIDLRDGKLDGRPPPVIITCRGCQRTLNPRHRHCLYCGVETPHQSPFAGL